MADDWRSISPGDTRPLPCLVPPAFAQLIRDAEEPEAQALRRQVLPSDDEASFSAGESSDPLGEARYLVTPHLVHQYSNRVLVLTTGACLGYCRYCFRKSFTARTEGFIEAEEREKICAYLKKTPNVQEILISGGDPLTVPPDELFEFLNAIRHARPDILIRLCTRGPVFAPELFTKEFIARLRSLRPLWVIPHINHPAELGPAQIACFTALSEAGIPQQSQTVLLRGVNDIPETLACLFHRLVCLGVKPGYLFQCDLAPGTAGFRVPLQDGLRIWNRLRELLSGLSLPQYAVDLPGGGGKFPLSVPALSDRIDCLDTVSGLSVRGSDGKVYTYPPN